MNKELKIIEEKTVIFYDDELLAFRTDEEEIYVSLRHVCQALGLNVQAQKRRIERHTTLHGGLMVAMMATIKGEREAYILRADLVPLWLSGIETSRVKEELRTKLERFQHEAGKVLWQAFQEGRLTADVTFDELLKEDTPATQAYKMIAAMMQLARQQVMLEARLNSQAIQLENHEQRLEYIETQLGDQSRTISESQAMQISQAVKAIGMLWGNQEKKNRYGAVFGRLYEKFEITSYRLLPAHRFNEAMEWLTQWYVETTGQPKLPF